MTLDPSAKSSKLLQLSIVAIGAGGLGDLSPFALPAANALVSRAPDDKEQPRGKGSSPSKATCEVTHLAQAHEAGEKPDRELMNSVLGSQLKVAEYLRRNKDKPIVLEGLTENLTPERHEKIKNSKSPNMVELTKKVFPKGLPNELKDFSKLQREFLYEIGAAKTMWYLGEIPNVRRSIDPETSKKIDDEIVERGEKKYGKEKWPLFVSKDKELQALVFGRREEAALKEVKELQAAGAKSVTLIFGAAHRLSNHAESNPTLLFKRVETTGSD